MHVHSYTQQGRKRHDTRVLYAQVMGVPSNKDYLACVMADPRFAAGETTTSFLKDLDFSPHGIEVIDPGMNTTVQVCCAVLCCAVLCCAVLCRAVPCRAVLCCAVPCRAVLCCAVPCNVHADQLKLKYH